MAIQHRRGQWSDFNPAKLLPGEGAYILGGDPNSVDGQSVYFCFNAGNVKRMATYEDMVQNIQNATSDIQEQFTEELQQTLTDAESTLSDVEETLVEAVDKLSDVTVAIGNANTATAAANEAADKANEAAAAAGELPNRVDEIEGEVDNLYDMTNGKAVDDNAYSVTVPNGAKFATVKKLGGKSIAWNQLVKTYRPSKEVNGISFTVDEETGKVVINGTATADTNYMMTTFSVIAGHKYLLMGNFVQQNRRENIYMNCTDNVNISNTIIVRNRAVVKEISVSADNYCMCIVVKNGEVLTNTCFIPQAFDLTQMFGQGNEPTVEEFEAMFPENFYTGNDGKIISADVAKTRNIGKNLFSTQEMVDAFANALTLSKNEDGIIWLPPATPGNNGVPIFKGCFKPHTRYTFFIKNANKNPTEPFTNLRVYFTDGTYVNLRFESNENYDYAFYRTPNNRSVDALSSVWEGSVSQIDLNESAIVEGYYENIDDIPSYKGIETSVPESIRSIEGYGWSAGDVYNEVDFENKKFIKRVGKIVLNGTEHWTLFTSTGLNQIRLSNLGIEKSAGGTPKTLNAKYLDISIDDRYFNYNTCYSTSDTGIAFNIENMTVESWKEYLTQNPLTVYYVMTEPVITDISDILDSFEVESGDTISFVQSDDTKHLPVPNTIEYSSTGADKIAQLEDKVDNLESAVETVQQTANEANRAASTAVSGVKGLNTDVDNINEQIITINQDITNIEQDITDINEHITAEKDYIVEQGTSGIWTYRKWESGVAECWGIQRIQSMTVEYGNCVPCQVTLPFAFAKEPIVNINFGVDGMANVFMAYTSMNANNQTIMAYGSGVTNSDEGKRCWFYIHAAGKI